MLRRTIKLIWQNNMDNNAPFKSSIEALMPIAKQSNERAICRSPIKCDAIWHYIYVLASISSVTFRQKYTAGRNYLFTSCFSYS